MAVIDASIYVAFINSHEPGHQASHNWILQVRAKREPLIAPNILLPEVCAAIRRGIGKSALSRQVWKHLRSSTVISMIPVTDSLANRAAEITVDHAIRGCDAVYVALAEQRGHTLVTLNRQQLQRAAALVPTTTP